MKKRNVLWIVLFLGLILAPVAIAETYSGEHYDRGNLTYMNISYTIMGDNPTNKYEQNYSRVMFVRKDTGEIIRASLGKCYEKGLFEYCYKEQYYDWNSKYTYENPGGRIEPKMKLTISYKSPDVKIDRLSEYTLQYDSPQSIVVKLKNTGTTDIVADFYEDLPLGVSAYDCMDCKISGSRISKRALLYEGSNVTFSYTIKKSDYKNSSWTSYCVYEYNNKTFNTTSTVNLKLGTPFELSESLSATSSNDLDKSFEYYFNIKNLENSVMNTRLFFNLKDFTPLQYTGWQRNENIYFVDTIVGPKSEKKFEFRLKPKKIGANVILKDIHINVNNVDFNSTKNSTYTVNANPLKINITLDNTSYLVGQLINASIWISNPDGQNDYFNVFGTLKGISDEYFSVPSLLVNQNMIIKKVYYAEYNTTINVTVSYDSKTGQEFKISSAKPIIVNGGRAPPIITVPNMTTPQSIQDIIFVQNTSDTSNTSVLNTSQIPGNQNSTAGTDTYSNTTQTNNTNNVNNNAINNNADNDEDNSSEDWLSKLFSDLNKFFDSIFGSKKK